MPGQGTALGRAPHKSWVDLTDKEKIEVLRTQIFNMRYVVRRVGELEADMHRMKMHEHGEGGKITVPIMSVNAMGASAASMLGPDPLA